jgi:uncharacterized SAM-binding protein YcdF (DUF218 family)
VPAAGLAETTPGDPRWRRRLRRAIRGGLLVGLVGLVLVLTHRPLLVGFAYLFRVDDPPAPSDALVVLLGGMNHRPMKAAELYRRGLAPTVLLGTSAPIPFLDLSEAALNRQVLLRGGVPAGAIRMLPGEVTSTRDEALRVRDYARSRGVRRITVVTTGFHTARARWIFRKVLRGSGVEVRLAAAADPRFDESNWYTNDEGLTTYVNETAKRVYYWLAY